MKDKQKINRIRESAGHANIGRIEDGAIVRMEKINNRVIAIKEYSIYELIMADNIDPERTNADIPTSISKLIIDKGTESEIVARTFLLATKIFKQEYLEKNVDCDKVLSLVIDILSELSLLEKKIEEYKACEDKESINYEERKSNKESYQLPSIINLESRCKTIFQKADHIEQTLMEIISHFYTDKGFTKQSHFPKFYDILKSIYGEQDKFTCFINKKLYFMRIIRELRNGLDHRLSTVTIVNYELNKDDMNIISPTIELTHKEVKLERVSLSEFLNITFSNLMEIIEIIFAFLAKKNEKTNGMYQLREIPENKRIHKYIKYGFWMPIGDEGYYIQ